MRIDIHTKKRYTIKTLNPTDKEGFFYPAFEKITKEVTDFLEDVEDFQWHCPEDILRFQRNNIFSFCASRGQGKTSALLSFGDYLSGLSYERENSPKEDNRLLQNGQFYSLPFVDPTLLETQDSILKTILSRMFQVLQEKEKEWSGSSSYSKDFEKNKYAYGKLLGLFSACFESVDVIKQEQSSTFQEHQDNLEQLSLLGDSSNLKVQFQELVEAYLDFLFQDSGKKKYLVISLDDTDMNVKKTFDIIEDIRKYFILPSIILLLATDLTQLEECVEQHFLGEFDKSIQANSVKYHSACHRLTQNYMSKFLPIAHRIHLPDITEFVTDPLASVVLSINGSVPVPYKTALFQLVQEKVGIYLAEKEGEFHVLLPKTFRHLYAFIIFLEGLSPLALSGRDDIPYGASTPLLQALLFHKGTEEEKGKEKEIKESVLRLWKGNLKEFTEYLTVDWARIYCTEEEMVQFQEIFESSPLSLKKNLVKNLYQQSSFLEEEQLQFQSLADTRYMIELFQKYSMEIYSEDKTYFCGALHLYLTLYTTRLLVQEWLENLKEEKEEFTHLNPYKGILAFTGGGEIPWNLAQGAEPFQMYGGFSLDSDVLYEEFIRIGSKKRAISKMCLRVASSKKKDIIFDPIHLQGMFQHLEQWDYLEEGEGLHSETILDLLRILLNWDLTKVLLEELEEPPLNSSTYADFLMDLMLDLSMSFTHWRGLKKQQAYFYYCVSSVSQRFYPHISLKSQEWDSLEESLLPHQSSLLDCFYLWELVFLSFPQYRTALRKKLKAYVALRFRDINIEALCKKMPESLHINSALIRSEIQSFAQGESPFGEDYGTEDFLLKIMGDSRFFEKYLETLSVCGDFSEKIQSLAEEDPDYEEKVEKLKASYTRKYEDSLEALYGTFPED